MNKKEINYVSPTVAVKEITFEGVLCMSFVGPKNNEQIEEWGTAAGFSWDI